MSRKFMYFGIAGFLSIAGCSISEKQQLASTFCDCYEPILAAHDALEKGIADSLPMEKRTALADALVYARISSRACIGAAQAQQHSIQITDEDLAVAIQQQCPEVYAHYAGEVAP